MAATSNPVEASLHSSVYDIITEQIVQQLESGVAPWRKPWNIAPPANLVSGKPYRGINVLCWRFADGVRPIG
jgi:antirestriction protein ArdC